MSIFKMELFLYLSKALYFHYHFLYLSKAIYFHYHWTTDQQSSNFCPKKKRKMHPLTVNLNIIELNQANSDKIMNGRVRFAV